MGGVTRFRGDAARANGWFEWKAAAYSCMLPGDG